MLTKQDLEQIDEIIKKRVDGSIQSAFEDFYDHVFEPFATRNEQHHQEIVREIKKLHKKEDEQDEYLKEHDGRISELEKAIKVKN